MNFNDSYQRHDAWYNQQFPTQQSKIEVFNTHKQKSKDNLANWLQQIFFSCLDPLLLDKGKTWLTIGDAYGFDAEYIQKHNNKALATDLNTDFLQVAKNEGIITDCAAENAEKLTFADETFDYVLCKESYHHFPRPYAAIYEMLRVAKSAIVIIEPQDPISKMPLLLFISNLLTTYPRILRKIWKNRFSYEPVGNFVYKVSEREFEKVTAGLGLPTVAFKKINPNFWFKGAERVTKNHQNKLFVFTKGKKIIYDCLVQLRIIPAQTLATIIFKKKPDASTLQTLQQEGYRIVDIPSNPYL